MGPAQAFKSFFQNLTEIEGRASRSEFWWVQLPVIVILLIPQFLQYLFIVSGNWAAALSMGDLQWVVAIIVGLSVLTLGVRRMHDRDLSGWWIILGYIPVVQFGVLVLFAWKAPRVPIDLARTR